MIEHFEKDKTVFFVSSRMYFFDGVTYQGDRAKAKVRFGIICAETRFKGYKALIEKAGYAFSTGNGAFDRKKFLELEGFDSIYLPGRYEDVDLCFRAWKAGYKGIYEPKSIIYHKGYGSFKAVFRDKQIYMVVFRNSLLFTWKNVLDFRILLSFYFWLPLRMAFFIITGRLFFLRGLWRALLRLPVVAQRRKAALKKFKLSDRDILRLVG
jgi:GT2 family glycosyltransferase